MPKYQFPYIHSTNRPPVLMQQLTADYIMRQCAWDEIITQLNEMAKESRLIKPVVCNTYNTATGVLGKAKNKILAASPNHRINNCKQPNQGSKNVRLNSRDQDTKSTTAPAQKAKSTKPISKSNTRMMTDDQQSVSMISENTDSQDDTETDHVYDHSSDLEAMMDILCLISESDSDEDDSLFGTD